MIKKCKKIGILVVACLILGSSSSFIAIVNSNPSNQYVLDEEQKINKSNYKQELDLLYGEIGFFISIPPEQDSSFNVTYSLPPNYKSQAPILVEIKNDTTANILSYEILNDSGSPNIAINFSITSAGYDEAPFVHFDFWVLVKNDEFDDMPSNAEIPDEENLPSWTDLWLESTKAVQSDSIMIKLKASMLRKKCDDLLNLTNKIVSYTSNHKNRFILNLLANFLCLFKTSSDWVKFLDARSSLFFGGSCTGRANLGTALFRANGIPARVLHVIPTWPDIENNDWFDMHYISEYYLPGYDWVLSETTIGITPFEQKNNIVLRINYPKDENLAGNCCDYYGGCEPWFWTESKDIKLFWKSPRSGARGRFNNNITTNQTTADDVFNITKKVYDIFTKYAGVDLIDINQQYFENATLAQKNAVECFKQRDIDGYSTNISYAFDQFQQIIS